MRLASLGRAQANSHRSVATTVRVASSAHDDVLGARREDRAFPHMCVHPVRLSDRSRHFPRDELRGIAVQRLRAQRKSIVYAANTRGPSHGAVEPPVFSFGHAATVREGPARVHSQELQDAQWWKKGSASTVNQERNRDVEGYWAAANEAHADVSGELRQVSGPAHGRIRSC